MTPTQICKQVQEALEAALNSDMAMREEDEGYVSETLESLRTALALMPALIQAVGEMEAEPPLDEIRPESRGPNVLRAALWGIIRRYEWALDEINWWRLNTGALACPCAINEEGERFEISVVKGEYLKGFTPEILDARANAEMEEATQPPAESESL